MKAQSDGITSVVILDNPSDYATFAKAIPQECRLEFAYGDPSFPNGITLNRLKDKSKLVHMSFGDSADHSAELSALGKIIPTSGFLWTNFPASVTVTDVGASKISTIDADTLEQRYRIDSEPASPTDLSWLNNLGVVPVIVSNPDQVKAATEIAAATVGVPAAEIAANAAAVVATQDAQIAVQAATVVTDAANSPSNSTTQAQAATAQTAAAQAVAAAQAAQTAAQSADAATAQAAADAAKKLTQIALQAADTAKEAVGDDTYAKIRKYAPWVAAAAFAYWVMKED